MKDTQGTLPAGERWRVSQRMNADQWPEDWPRVKLGEHVEILNGSAFASAKFSRDEGMPLIRIRDVGKDQTETYYSGGYQERYLVQPGEILVGMDGDFRCRRWGGAPALLNQRVCKISVVSESLDEEYLFQLMQPYLDAVHAVTSSVTVKHLSSSTIERLEIPLPDLRTQRWVAAYRQTMRSHVSHANDYLTAIPPLIDQFRQSVLARAFTGELTADWRKNHPDVEPASELLERIKVERREKWIENYARNLADRARKRNEKKGEKFTNEDWQAYFDKKVKAGANKYEEPAAIDAAKEGLPEIPETWEWVRLGELCSYVTSGSRGWGKYYSDDGALFIRIGDLSGAGIDIDFHDAQHVELPDGVEGQRSLLKQGDILVSITADVGSIGVVSEELGAHEAYINQHIAVCRPATLGLAIYLGWALRSPWGAQAAIGEAEYGATKASLNLDQVRDLPVPIAPARERAALLDRLEQALVLNQTIEMRVSKIHEQLLGQVQSSLLHSEMRGVDS